MFTAYVVVTLLAIAANTFLGAIGLLLGLIGVPLIGTAAAIGLVLFFVCAIHTHLLARDYSPQFGLAIGFLLLNVAVLGLALS